MKNNLRTICDIFDVQKYLHLLLFLNLLYLSVWMKLERVSAISGLIMHQYYKDWMRSKPSSSLI